MGALSSSAAFSSRLRSLRETHFDPAVERFTPVLEVVPGLFRVKVLGSYAYLANDDHITLIDTGAPGSAERILRAIRSIGRSPLDVTNVLLTHNHIDHVGGLAELRHYLPARVGIHSADAEAAASDEPLPNPSVNPVVARVLQPYLERFDPGALRIDDQFRDGDEFPALGGVRVVHVPGHTPGSVAFHFRERGAVLTGDAVQFRFGRLMPPSRIFTADMDVAIGSLRRLSQLDFDTLCFGHHRPIVRGADVALRALVRELAS